jgi:predicted RNase H-like HicB family nuclease
MIKDLEYYLSLDYDIVVRELDNNEGDGWFAYYKDIKGIMGDGDTKDEAITDVKSAFKEYIKVSLKNGDDILEPNIKYYSKRINITLPSNILHDIDNYAFKNNISRSQLIQKAAINYIR